MNAASLHIVHIIPEFGFGGAERFVVELTRHVSGAGVRHTVVVLGHHTDLEKELPKNVRLHTLHFEKISRWKRVGVLTEVLSTLKPQVVHTHLFGADLWGRLAAQRLHIPVVTTEHNINVAESWIRMYTKRIMKNFSSLYTAPSQAVADFLYRAYGVTQKNVKIIRHGIDVSRFVKIPAARFTAPYRLGVVGRLVHQKGHSVVLDALWYLKDLPVQLTIVGEGELKDQLQAYAKKRGVAGRVEWKKPRVDVEDVYKECDMIVVPSRWEGLGLVVLEAQASRRVVIASDVDGISEIVKHKKTGLLVPCEDARAFAEAVRYCVKEKEVAARMAEQARVWVQKNSTIETMAQKYKKIYESLTR